MTTEQHLKIIRAKCVELLEASIAFPHDANKAAEAAFKSTIVAIDRLLPIIHKPYFDGHICDNDGRGCSACDKVEEALSEIISAWPEELLT